MIYTIFSAFFLIHYQKIEVREVIKFARHATNRRNLAHSLSSNNFVYVLIFLQFNKVKKK